MSAPLSALLAGEGQPGIYRLTSRVGADAVAAQAAHHGWRFAYLNGRQIKDKADFLQACAEALIFPAYSGKNWDALEENLRDLAWAPAERGYLVLYDDASAFAKAHPADFAIALDILCAAVASWRATPTPMTVLLRRTGRTASAIPRLRIQALL